MARKSWRRGVGGHGRGTCIEQEEKEEKRDGDLSDDDAESEQTGDAG